MGAGETKHVTVVVCLGAPGALLVKTGAVVVAVRPAGEPGAAAAPAASPDSAVESLSEVVRLLASRVSALEAAVAADPQAAKP